MAKGWMSPSAASLTLQHLGDPWALLATAGGCGLVPWAPGTVGTVLAALVWWLLLADLPVLSRLAITLLAGAAAFGAIHLAVKRHALGDDPAIVLDEVIGCWLALVAAPKAWGPVLIGVLLFRAADIFKPWPVSWAERRAGALGILLDDIVAGAMAAIALCVGALVMSGAMMP